jgi:hypothetical protein
MDRSINRADLLHTPKCLLVDTVSSAQSGFGFAVTASMVDCSHVLLFADCCGFFCDLNCHLPKILGRTIHNGVVIEYLHGWARFRTIGNSI